MAAPTLESAWQALVPRSARVVAVAQETPDTWTLTLDAGDFEARPGQFNMLYAFGVGEAPISISGDTDDRGALVHTIRAVGRVTDALCRAQPGDVLGVRGPFGTPWPVEAAQGGDALVVAGGLGLAPLRPVIYQLLRERPRFGRVSLFVGARTAADLSFREELLAWRSALEGRVYVTVDRDTPETEWGGDVGVVTTLLPRGEFDPNATTAFVCGPEVMMRFSALALVDLGLPPERIYVSAERSMKCAVGHCGHCQFGRDFVCKDGPVYAYPSVAERMRIREL